MRCDILHIMLHLVSDACMSKDLLIFRTTLQMPRRILVALTTFFFLQFTELRND